jgi:hypothetical protein
MAIQSFGFASLGCYSILKQRIGDQMLKIWADLDRNRGIMGAYFGVTVDRQCRFSPKSDDVM